MYINHLRMMEKFFIVLEDVYFKVYGAMILSMMSVLY